MVKNFEFSISSRIALGAQPSSYPMGTGGFSQWIKRLGREADHSPPTSAEVKKRGLIIPPDAKFGPMLARFMAKI
jgi:hypothetical protein